MGIPTDVPVQRPSVGAMGWMGNQYPAKITRPYVYQGTGEDQFPETDPAYRQPKPKKRRKAKPRREYDRWQAVRSLPLPPQPDPETRPEPKPRSYVYAKRIHEMLPLTPPPPRPRAARPAPGWQPTTGSDLDAILEELEV